MKREKILCSRFICLFCIIWAISLMLCGCSVRSRRLDIQRVSSSTESSEPASSMAEDSGSSSNMAEGAEPASEMEEGGDRLNSDTIFVHVCGAVKDPDLYELVAGSRVGDAIRMAGGFTKNADSTSVNLAAVLEDGIQIYVCSKEEGQEKGISSKQGATSSDLEAFSGGSQAAVSGKEVQKASSGKVNVNTAGVDELTSLQGIGDSRAQAIVQYREEHGTFASIEEIKSVSGIGDGIYNQIKDSITVQ